MNKLALRRTAVLALLFALLLAPVLAGGWYVIRKHVWADERLAQLEPRYARLLGLERQRAELEAATRKASELHAGYLYPSGQDGSQTGNQAQQKVRDIFTAAGLQISSMQVLPAKEEKGLDRIPLLVRAEGDILGVQSALAVLGGQSPVILLNELDLQVQGGLVNVNPKAAVRLAIQFNLSVLRDRP
ncbi:type II secretion system protein GspM [Pulveribacter suum]|uniref:General secretion pathway protein GspM n=1 Tax=Pulveribacter suum TaxID=2116657 RepID=A0A2P1NP65_9BURK|nr:type II secretion system protein GspM [Pulveribacter suum]AVP58854.1 general secretion pathway protein GspM [Pulveribacter suum]